MGYRNEMVAHYTVTLHETCVHIAIYPPLLPKLRKATGAQPLGDCALSAQLAAEIRRFEDKQEAFSPPGQWLDSAPPRELGCRIPVSYRVHTRELYTPRSAELGSKLPASAPSDHFLFKDGPSRPRAGCIQYYR